MSLHEIQRAEASVLNLRRAAGLIDSAMALLLTENVIVSELRFFKLALEQKIEWKEGAAQRMRK